MARLPGAFVGKPKDGGLRVGGGTGNYVGCVVGTATSGTEDVIQEFVDPDDVRTEYGRGDLPDALCDALLNGASSILGIRVKARTDGSATLGDKTSSTLVLQPQEGVHTGSGSTAVSGTPTENATIDIEVLSDGAVGVATFQWRKNSGSWSSPLTTAATVVLGTTGLVLAFSDGSEGTSFVDGDTYQIVAVADSVGTVAVGSGTNPFETGELEIEIVNGGGINEAVFVARVGVVELEPQAVQASVELPEFGVNLAFAENGGGSQAFVSGDLHVINMVGRSVDVNDVMTSLGRVKDRRPGVHVVYLCGQTDSVTWAMFETVAETFRLGNRWMFFIMDSKHPDRFDTVGDWVADLVADAGETRGVRICVVPTRAVFTDYDNAAVQAVRSISGCLLGRLLSIPPNRSPGRVMDGPLAGPLRLYPYDDAGDPTVADGQILQLDTAGFTTGRNFEGQGRAVFVTNFRMMAADGSDYVWGENRRVMDHACRGVFLSGQKYTHFEGSAEGVEALKTELKETPRTMLAARMIGGFDVSIPAGQDIVATSTVQAKVAIQPLGTMRWIDVDIGFVPGEVTE